MIKITCISDLHGFEPELPGGDLLIIGGDLTAWDFEEQYTRFFKWAIEQEYEKIVVIAGNHDGDLEAYIDQNYEGHDFNQISYLRDKAISWRGLSIYGSPWTPDFCNWYWMKPRNEMKMVWDKIPDCTDILVTHGPPMDILDEADPDNRRIGCYHLKEAIERINPKLHVFGHIHGGYGEIIHKNGQHDIHCVNASIMNEQYKPLNKPINLEFCP